MPAAPEEVDMRSGVWLEHRNPEHGRYIVHVSEGLEKGRFFFENNMRLYTEYYNTFELKLWEDGKVVAHVAK